MGIGGAYTVIYECARASAEPPGDPSSDAIRFVAVEYNYTMPPRITLRLVPALCATLILASHRPRDAVAASPDSTSVSTPSDTTPAANPPRAGRRPRIGLVLGGGGARGDAHIGLLHVLEEHRIPVDFIAGTSAGALIGGLYASGLSPGRIDTLVTDTDWLDAFTDKGRRGDRTFCRKRDDDLFLIRSRPGLRRRKLMLPPGVLDGHRIDLLLRRLTLPVVSVREFDQLSIPFRAVAADLVTGDAVVLDHGDLAQAMRASLGVPTVFAPREIDGRLLVDGGVADNLPIDLVRRMGADVVIAMDIAPAPMDRDALVSLPKITFHLTVVAAERNQKRQIASLGDRDVYLRPDLGSITIASFDRGAEAVEIGRRAAVKALNSLERYAVSPEEYRAWQEQRAARVPADTLPVIAAVRIDNRSRVADEVIAQRLEAAAGPLDVARLEHGVDRVFGLELFESTYYDIRRGPEGDDTLTVTAIPRRWGPDYLQAGIGVFDDYAHPDFDLALQYTRTEVNRLNGEWSAGVQIGEEPAAWGRAHQPLDTRLRWFAEAQPAYVDWTINTFDDDGHKLGEYGVQQYGVTLAGGRELGSWAEVRGGIVRQGGELRVQVGVPQPSRPIDTGELFVQFHADELDGLAFPHQGFMLRGRAAAGLEALGSAVDYQQVFAEGSLVETRRRITGVVGATLALTAGSDAPLESQFRLGGLGRLSGLQQDERIGQHAALLRAMIYQRVSKLWPVYGGLSLEYGNTFHSRSDVSFDDAIPSGALFLGAETPLGPLCLAWGFAEGGRDNFYLTLGQAIGARRPGIRPR